MIEIIALTWNWSTFVIVLLAVLAALFLFSFLSRRL